MPASRGKGRSHPSRNMGCPASTCSRGSSTLQCCSDCDDSHDNFLLGPDAIDEPIPAIGLGTHAYHLKNVQLFITSRLTYGQVFCRTGDSCQAVWLRCRKGGQARSSQLTATLLPRQQIAFCWSLALQVLLVGQTDIVLDCSNWSAITGTHVDLCCRAKHLHHGADYQSPAAREHDKPFRTQPSDANVNSPSPAQRARTVLRRPAPTPNRCPQDNELITCCDQSRHHQAQQPAQGLAVHSSIQNEVP